jgi:hypothetical protein
MSVVVITVIELPEPPLPITYTNVPLSATPSTNPVVVGEKGTVDVVHAMPLLDVLMVIPAALFVMP